MKKTEFYKVKAADKYLLEVKLDYPENPKSVVILCPGSGPNTYDNHRKAGDIEFNYFDLFSDELYKRNIAFCRWNTRGCILSDNPPDYVSIDPEGYATYYPSNSIEDILTIKSWVQGLSQFRKSQIILMGISEGATLVPFAAAKCADLAAILLVGFSYENMKDTLEWQLTGGSSMVNICKFFGCTEIGYVDKADFVRDKYNIRPYLFEGVTFEELDLDKDDKLTRNDFALQMAEYRHNIYQAIEKEDDEWLIKNYVVPITAKWCKEHFALPPVSNVLCSLTIPIWIFQGCDDANIPASDIIKIQSDYCRTGQDKLHILTFPRHDHDLNYMEYPLYGKISKGLRALFNTAQNI